MIEAVEEQGAIEMFCTIPIKQLKENSITELDVSKGKLCEDGNFFLSYFLKDAVLLSKLTWSASSQDKQLTWSGTTCIESYLDSPRSYFIAQGKEVDKELYHKKMQEWYDTDAFSFTLDTTVTEADFNNKHLGASGAMVLAAFISRECFQKNGSLSALNLLNSSIGTEQAQELIKIKQETKVVTLCGLKGGETELDVCCKTNGAADNALILAEAIQDMRALKKLTFGGGFELEFVEKRDCSGDRFEVGQFVVYQGQQCVVSKVHGCDANCLGVKCSLTIDTTMTKADFSDTGLGVSEATILAAWLKDNGSSSLASLNLANNDLGAEGARQIASALHGANGALTSLDIADNALVKRERGTGSYTEKTYDSDGGTDDEATEIMEPDCSGILALLVTALASLSLANNNLGADGAQIVAEALEEHTAMASVNLLKNNIGEEQIQNLIKIKKDKGMISLCGLHQGQTEADFINQGLGVADARLVASDIQDMGSLSSVNLLKNNIGDEQMQSLIKIKKEKGMLSLCGLHQGQTEADFSNQGLGAEDAKLIVSDIQGMGSLSKFTFSGDHRESKPVTVEVGMTAADFSRAKLQSSGAIILAGWLEHKVP
jgi:23S rRNA U2552 (ribose-2'-O)-methylase RlmE/FtsJ